MRIAHLIALALPAVRGGYQYDELGIQRPLVVSPPVPPSDISVPVPLEKYFNNRAARTDPGQGGMAGAAYPAHLLPRGKFTHGGVAFTLPDWGAAADNIRTSGEHIAVPQGEMRAVHLLAAGEGSGGFNLGNTHEELGLHFADGSTFSAGFVVKTWWAHHWTNKGAIRVSFQYAPEAVYNASHIFHTVVHLPPATAGKQLVGITLPGERGHNSLHVFALSLEPTGAGHARAVVPLITATRRWEDVDEAGDRVRAQVVEVNVRNPASVARHSDRTAWIDTPFNVSLRGGTFRTLVPARVARLMPGDEVRVEVLVLPTGLDRSFSDAWVDFSLNNSSWSQSVTVAGCSLIHDFSAWTESEVESHSAPSWFSAAKFGIFIHWGLFAVPAWADAPRYAEWYDFWIHDDKPGMPAHEHHRAAWGENFVYDDFIPLFTAERFNASSWLELVSDAGARYFVFTTKHHDGFAMFDTRHTSDRNSVLLGPRRDFLAELMTTAKENYPHLRRGTYFSLPEWYSPLYVPHARVSFPGGPARNPYTGEIEPYTGFSDVGDFISGIQLPQMRILAEYGTELMWCDIGLANASSTFAAEWFANTTQQGRQVAMSNRCGIGGDFDTPEMESFDAVEEQWEACASMDPWSFGYAANTPDSEYRNASSVVHTLLDVVAKGGNFLLNVGPRADGTIPEVMSRPLREAGKWIKLHSRAIFDTVPFPLLPEVKDREVVFTRAEDAFYIISMRDLEREWRLEAPLPILPCDEIVLIAERGDVPLKWTYDNGVLAVDLSQVDEDKYSGGIAYVFEVRYRQCQD